MKKAIIAAAAGGLFLIALAAWHGAGPAAPSMMQVKASQIHIHGTPVCVIDHGGKLVARVGECGRLFAPGEEGPLGGAPSAGEEGAAKLPPGHPPVPGGFPPLGGRPVAI